jgi:hypothetical protein
MSTLATAFGLAGIAVAAYATWLAREQHRLRRRLEALEAQTAEDAPCRPRSHAA